MHNSFPIQEIVNVPIMYLTVDTETVQKTMVKRGRFAMSRNHQHVQMWQIASLKRARDSRIRPVPMEVVVSLSYLHPIFVTSHRTEMIRTNVYFLFLCQFLQNLQRLATRTASTLESVDGIACLAAMERLMGLTITRMRIRIMSLVTHF